MAPNEQPAPSLQTDETRMTDAQAFDMILRHAVPSANGANSVLVPADKLRAMQDEIVALRRNAPTTPRPTAAGDVLAMLQTPEGVHANMLAGKIAKISPAQCAHTHGSTGVEPTDEQIDAVFTAWAGKNDFGVPYLRTYEQGFRSIARAVLALAAKS